MTALHAIAGGRSTVTSPTPTAAPVRAPLPPPAHDLRAEETLLCSLLLGACAVDDVSGYLTAEHFYAPSNRYVFQAILDAVADGLAVDETTVFAKLRAAGRLVDVGGLAGLTRIIDNNPTDGAALSYVRILLDCWALRKAGEIGRELAIQSRQPVASVAALLTEAHRQIEALADACKVQVSATDLATGITEDIRAIEAKAARGPLQLCPTGYPSLDVALSGGWPREWLVVVGAESETGKTAFAMENAVACAEAVGRGGGASLYLSFELSRSQARQRLMSNVSGVGRTQIERMSDPGRITQSASYLATLPIYVEEARKFGQIRQEVRRHERLAAAKGLPLKLVIVDFLQFVEADTADPKGNREKELADMMQAMKNLRLDYPDTVFMVLSQLNEAGQTRGSRAILHPVDQSLYLRRPDPKEKTVVVLEFGKGRGVANAEPLTLSMDPVSGRLTEGQP